MKKFSVIALSVAVFALMAWPQDEAQHATIMKSINTNNKSLRANMKAKNGEAVAKDAKALAEAFGPIHEFWTKKGADDAVKSALTAKDGFTKVATLATEGKLDEAVAPMRAAGDTCMSCHNAHRERQPDGSFKIK